MAVYLLETSVDAGAGRSSVAGADSMVVVAASVADARAVAKSANTGVSASAWDKARVTEVKSPDDAKGFWLVVAVMPPDQSGTLVEVKVMGHDGDSLDDLGRKAARALNDSDEINGAAFSMDSHVLTVASMAGGDKLGDHKVYAAVLPPDVKSGSDASIPGLVKSVIDKGNPEDSLQVVLASPDYALPRKVVAFGSGS